MFRPARWPMRRRERVRSSHGVGRLRPDVSAAAAREDAPRHQRAALPDLAVVVSGREGDVGPAGSEGARRRRRRLDARLRAGRRRVRAAHRVRERREPAASRARCDRSRELAIRSALGASRGRLLQHLMVESGVLTAGAAAVGLASPRSRCSSSRVYGANYIPRIDEVRLRRPAHRLAGVARGGQRPS